MAQNERAAEAVDIEITNIGGIEHAEATLEPGITLLSGRNATNRTSFLQAVMAACGSEEATLKADAEEGTVRLTVGEETHTRTLTKRHGQTHFGGDPYLDDPTLAEMYAFLLGGNEARRAVASDADLHDVIMRPVDTDEIERKIRNLEHERDEIDEELDRLVSLSDRLPKLEEKKHRLEEDISEKKEALTTKKQEIAERDASVEEQREQKRRLEEKIEKLSEHRREQQRIEQRISSEHESIEDLENEGSELEERLSELDPVPDERLAEIEGEIQRRRGQIQEIEATLGDLQSVIQFNEEFLDGEGLELSDDIGASGPNDTEDVTDQLLDERREVTCWTCGSTVSAQQIESTLDRLRTVRSDRMTERQSLETEIDSLQEEISTLEDRQQTRDRTKRKLTDVEREIEDRESTIEDLRQRQSETEETIDRLESEIEDLNDVEQSEVIEAQKAASRLEVELERLETELAEVKTDIESTEDSLAERDQIEQQREQLTSEIATLRTRVVDLEKAAIEEFNDHMDEILVRLGYDNLERIWIERTNEEVREGGQKVTKTRFDLHVVRRGESGAVFEDSIAHLSESEVEVTGLVFALAGYLVHEVHDLIPFMLIDSIEAIDSTRIAKLVDYVGGYADYLVVALLEEDATAIDGNHAEIAFA
jgi:septal ring factor EnvC (AmiA/AmiB activator)